MTYVETVRQLSNDAEQMEFIYQEAVSSGEADAFAAAIDANYAEAMDNLLYAAWYYRLAHVAAKAKGRVIAWGWAIPLAVLNGLLLWFLSDNQRFTVQLTNPLTGLEVDLLPAVALLAAPISAAVIVLFLAAAGDRRWGRVLAIVLGLGALSAYVLLVFPQLGTRVFQEQYVSLMVMHLALLAWAGVGVLVLTRQGHPENSFAFLIKSLEAFVMAGLFAIAGLLFTGITFGLFQALGMEPPDVVIRLFIAGGAGLLAVLAVAVIYDPTVEPARQAFDEGLSKLIATLMRLLLPLALLVLVIYLGFIPFNFSEPFENRDVLIIYNAMLFAVIALLVGATPVSRAELGQPPTQTWLRRGLIALAALALIVSLYALAAILYRTAIDRLTPNRLTFIGWNVINIGILVWLLIKQWQARRGDWLAALQATFAAGMFAYVLWVLVIILALPWLFGVDQADVANLPVSVQRLIYEEPYPILLKCGASPHIYLLEDGTKRWIQDIPTFEARGYRWNDVEFVTCGDLRAVPDGQPIPPDAGVPPQP
jgi:hypothetical protein